MNDIVRCVHTTDKKYTLEYRDGSKVEPEHELELNLKTQVEWEGKWDKPLLWQNLHDNADIEGTYYERRIFNLAVMAWEWKTKNLDVSEARKGEKPDIRNEWGNSETDSLFQERPSTLYYAYFPNQGSVSGLMRGNDDYLWGTAPGLRDLVTGGKEKVYDLQHTTAHELGHIFGLRHEANYSDHIMWPMYNQQRVPQNNDILRIQDKYGKRTPWGLRDAWIAIRLARGIKKRVI